MNDDFEQEIIEEEISGEEPLISHNHSNNNSYVNRNVNRNNSVSSDNNQRQNRGNNLGQRRNNSNNNPLTRNKNASNVNGNKTNSRDGSNNGLKNALENRRKKSNGVNRNGNNSKSSESSNESSDVNKKKSKGLMNMNDDSMDESSSSESEGKLKIKIPLAIKIKIAVIVLIIAAFALFIMVICAIFISIFGGGVSTTQNIYTDPDSINRGFCTELEVTFYKKIEENGTTVYEINEEVGENGVATYDLETYVAGVISGEVGVLKNEEVWKAFAVAARTYALRNNENCKIESSDRKQVMLPGEPASQFKKAAKDTEGEVLFDSDNNLISSMYDAFACYKKDEEFYYLKQGNIIPVSWVDEEFPNLNSKWTSCTMQQAHGEGMSQYGAYYLAEVYDFSYHELLYYYYSDKIKGFYCVLEEVEGSCPPEDTECVPEVRKVCDDGNNEDNEE